MVSDFHRAMLALLASSRKGMTAVEASAHIPMGTGAYVRLRRMYENGWLTRHSEPREGGGAPMVRYRVTSLGRAALRYADMERADAEA